MKGRLLITVAAMTFAAGTAFVAAEGTGPAPAQPGAEPKTGTQPQPKAADPKAKNGKEPKGTQAQPADPRRKQSPRRKQDEPKAKEAQPKTEGEGNRRLPNRRLQTRRPRMVLQPRSRRPILRQRRSQGHHHGYYSTAHGNSPNHHHADECASRDQRELHCVGWYGCSADGDACCAALASGGNLSGMARIPILHRRRPHHHRG